MTTEAIQPHNQKAAATWGAGGTLYDQISRTISDSIEHCIARLQPRPGERVLDLACGTGWASRAIAGVAPGARVVGVDLGADLIEAARSFATRAGLPIEYQIGDAEQLPFENGGFDVIVSTCGVMFVSRPEVAARELARVCKRGGRIGLTTWKPDSTIAEMFKVMKPYMLPPPAPAPPSPFAWGSPDRVTELLGGAFDLQFEEGVSVLRLPSGEAVWKLFSTGYGPTKSLAASLDAERREGLRRDFIAFHERFGTPLGIAMPREYLVTLGVRR
jgi:SAM-dependent methyltransferase